MVKLPEFPLGWHCCLLLCSDSSYYYGITSNLSQRLRDHSSGRGSDYTKDAKPVTCVWYEVPRNRKSAADRERQIKSWSKDKKRTLANGDSHSSEMGARVWILLG